MKKGHRTSGGVRVQVKGKNIAIAPALRDQVIQKISRLEKYLDRLQQIEVELCTEKTRDANSRNHVEATTRVRGRTIRVTADDSDMHAAIDEAVDKLYRQLNRTKERMKAHHNSKLAEVLSLDSSSLESVSDLPGLSDEAEAPVIHIERLEMKPQFEDEAIEEMDAQGRDFYVFLNARNEQVNVVYRRTDGTYGLIDPRAG